MSNPLMVRDMTQATINGALTLVLDAAATLDAVALVDLDSALELSDVVGHVGRAEAYLVAAGAKFGPGRQVEIESVGEAIGRTRSLLAEALDSIPREAAAHEATVYDATAAIFAAVDSLRGWA